jgi:flagellar biosynthesis/type III secretory pathway protein FliH
MEQITDQEQRAFTQGYNAGYSQGQVDAGARIDELQKQIEYLRKLIKEGGQSFCS